MRTKLARPSWAARRRGSVAALLTTVALLSAVTVADAANEWESEDVFGQGIDGPTVAVDGAAILRTPNAVTVKLSMPTPEPGSYMYPDPATWPTSSGQAGHPEAFSLWAFIFYNPEACLGDGCGVVDLFENPAAIAGAFNAGGHLAAGPRLNLSGAVGRGTSELLPPGLGTSLGDALDMGFDLRDAHIHLAVAPHGGLDPQLLPQSIKTPAGNPSFWWFALFT